MEQYQRLTKTITMNFTEYGIYIYIYISMILHEQSNIDFVLSLCSV